MRVINCPLTWTTTPATISSYAASGDISNATLYSVPFSLRHMDTYSIQLVTTGATVTGTFKLQASNSDPTIGDGVPDATLMDWTDIDGASSVVTVLGSVFFQAAGVGYGWVRVVWTESGTAAGAVTGRAQGKGAH